jgi:hypothetical protein
MNFLLLDFIDAVKMGLHCSLPHEAHNYTQNLGTASPDRLLSVVEKFCRRIYHHLKLWLLGILSGRL